MVPYYKLKKFYRPTQFDWVEFVNYQIIWCLVEAQFGAGQQFNWTWRIYTLGAESGAKNVQTVPRVIGALVFIFTPAI